MLPDCRELATLKVHADFSVRFNGNFYTVPPWAIVTVKADNHTVSIYFEDKIITPHTRCRKRKKRIKREAAIQRASQEVAAVASLCEVARKYLEKLAAANLPIKKDVTKLLALKDRYGTNALSRTLGYKSIRCQMNVPAKFHPPITLKDERLNRIRLEEPKLNEYDAFVYQRRGSRHDSGND